MKLKKHSEHKDEKSSLSFILILITVFIFSVYLGNNHAQTKSNLEIFYELVDSSANTLVKNIPPDIDSINLQLTLGDSYSLFGNRIISNLISSGKIISEENKNAVKVNYVIDDADVSYGEIFRDGWFGSYYVLRTVSLKGNFLIHGSSSYFDEFYFSFNDSIKYDDINSIENNSYPFTKGEIPSEPFFSGLFEPLVAIGTAAVAVILFFTIRSK